MASYGRAKAQLLDMAGLRCAIVNRDDPWAAGLATRAPESVQLLSYSLTDSSADIYLSDIELSRTGARAKLFSPWGEGKLSTDLLGTFNLSNLLAVIAAACTQGLPLVDVLRVVPELQPAPGRMQAVTLGQEKAEDISVIVDYAHTPDALENSLKALQAHNEGRLWCVFGCGGDRDKAKRPQMGRLAERYSDYVVVTNDNPRTEDPAQIAADIVRGMHNPNGCLIIADRAQAIDLAVQQARAGDIVLLAGKGHEDYQIFAGQTLPFSDIKQARLALQRRLSKREQEEQS
jgi:UDP-N-acetylmuramoyl-L-alanyl-D-glutamate--2,6-diaminopimelate ligase